MIEQFIKGSVWETGKPLNIRGVDLPIGSRFEVMYPRRRDSNLVGIKIIDNVSFARKRQYGADAPQTHTAYTRPSRKKRARFSNADELVRGNALDGAKLISKPEQGLEFFIRHKATGHLWAGNREIPMGFHEVSFAQGNHYVSAENARVGVVTILMNRKPKTATEAEEVPWEIVGYDPFVGAVAEIIDLSPVWWSNIHRLAALHRTLPREDGNKTRAQRLRRIANALPIDDRRWGFAVFLDFTATSKNSFADQRAALVEKMSHVGITDFAMMNDNVLLLMHDNDRVMMRLLFAEDIEVHSV